MRIHKNYGFIVVSVMFYLLLHIGTYAGLLVDFILIIRKFSFLNAFRQAPFKFPPKTNEYSFSHLGLTFRSLILQVVNLYFSRKKKRSNFLNQLSNTQKNIPFFQKQLVDIPMPLDSKSVNLQYITLSCLDDGTKESSTKRDVYKLFLKVLNILLRI